MTYEAIFTKQFDAAGNGINFPTDFLHHNAEVEDVTFGEMNAENGTETWRYKVTDETASRFEQALQNCEKVIEFKTL